MITIPTVELGGSTGCGKKFSNISNSYGARPRGDSEVLFAPKVFYFHVISSVRLRYSDRESVSEINFGTEGKIFFIGTL